MPVGSGQVGRRAEPAVAKRPTQIAVEVGGRVYTGDLDQETRVDTDPVGLSQALAENPGRFAWWATLEVLAKTQLEEVENRRAARHAELYSHYEAVLVRTDTEGKRGKPTVDTIKSAILKDVTYQQALTAVRKANEAAGLLGVARQAMLQRKDSLLAVASNYRAELDARIHDQLKAVRDKMRAAQEMPKSALLKSKEGVRL